MENIDSKMRMKPLYLKKKKLNPPLFLHSLFSGKTWKGSCYILLGHCLIAFKMSI